MSTQRRRSTCVTPRHYRKNELAGRRRHRGCDIRNIDDPRGGKKGANRRTATRLALDHEFAAMELDHRRSERESEPRTVMRAAQRAVDLDEGLQHAGDVGAGDADAGILNRDEEAA